MPVMGERKAKTVGTSYMHDPLYPFAKKFCETAQAIVTEHGCDLLKDPYSVMNNPIYSRDMRSFFCEDAVDTEDPTKMPEEIEDAEVSMEETFQNDIDAMNEHTVLGDLNPVIGMATPIHKLILMNNVFDKGGIQKVTARAPQFTISMERRILVTPDGDEIDMFTEQDKMTPAMDATIPQKIVDIKLPVTEDDNDFLAMLGGTNIDDLSVDSNICAVKMSGCYIDEGDILPNDEGYIEKGGKVATAEDAGEYDVWFHTKIEFVPNYGGPNHFEKICYHPLSIKRKVKDEEGNIKIEVVKEAISGSLNKNKMNLAAIYNNVTDIRLFIRLDTSNAMLDTCEVRWKVDTDWVVIPDAVPVNTTISPNEIKDIAALYNANQMTKLLGMFKTTMCNYKDDKIKEQLDLSYARLDERTSFFDNFDFAPTDQYALDPLEWRAKMFMDFLDDFATKMLQVLNDPNFTITVFGDPRIVRKITPKEYTYQAPSNIGPITLDYSQTIVNTTDKRTYNFIGSDKMRGTNELIILLNPRNSERIIYRIYDYQLYVSNEIRNARNHALPAIHAFERWKFVEYQPVQGRVQILNPSGLKK